MDQTTDLVEISYLLGLANITKHLSVYNFSETVAISYIQLYVDHMYTIRSPTTIALLCLYIPTFFFSLIGNCLVIYVVFKNKHMRRVKNLFLVNIAFADLAVTLVCYPMVVGQTVFRLWVYGEFMCKVTGYIQGIAVCCSIFSLASLSIDRLLAIKGPLNVSGIGRKCHAARIIVCLWLLAGLILGPMLFVRTVYTVTFTEFNLVLKYCIESWATPQQRKVYIIVLLLTTYVLPVFIIVICYTLIGRKLCDEELHRKTSDNSSTVVLGRKKVARMLVALIAVFVVCWMPYNIVSLVIDLNFNYEDANILPFTLWIGHVHSAINPVLYWFLNRSFRHCMRKTLWCSQMYGFGRDSPTPHPEGVADLFRFDFRREGPEETLGPTRFSRIHHNMGTLTPGSRKYSDRSRSPSNESDVRSGFICLGVSPHTTSSHLQASSTPRDEGSTEEKRSRPSPSPDIVEYASLEVNYSGPGQHRRPFQCSPTAPREDRPPNDDCNLPQYSDTQNSSSYFDISTAQSGSYVDSQVYSADV